MSTTGALRTEVAKRSPFGTFVSPEVRIVTYPTLWFSKYAYARILQELS
jgi:hypothetical protein